MTQSAGKMQPMSTAGKDETDAKHEKKCNQCQTQEEITPTPIAGKCYQRQTREKIKPMPSGGRDVNDTKRGKVLPALNPGKDKTDVERRKNCYRCQAEKILPMSNVGKDKTHAKRRRVRAVNDVICGCNERSNISTPFLVSHLLRTG